MPNSTVRDVEISLTQVEDDVQEALGYREYSVLINNIELRPKPEVIQKTSTNYTEEKVNQFIQAMGGRGNPSVFFVVNVSRLINEQLLRANTYWTVTREGYSAECLPVDFKVEDSRYKIVLGVIKQNAN